MLLVITYCNITYWKQASWRCTSKNLRGVPLMVDQLPKVIMVFPVTCGSEGTLFHQQKGVQDWWRDYIHHTFHHISPLYISFLPSSSLSLYLHPSFLLHSFFLHCQLKQVGQSLWIRKHFLLGHTEKCGLLIERAGKDTSDWKKQWEKGIWMGKCGKILEHC